MHFQEQQGPAGGGQAERPDPPPRPDSDAVCMRLGFLSCGGIYTSPIPLDLAEGGAAPVVGGLQASNISTEWRQRPGQPPCLLLRFWAEQPGPFDTSFSVRLPGQQQEEVSEPGSLRVPVRRRAAAMQRPRVHCGLIA